MGAIKFSEVKNMPNAKVLSEKQAVVAALSEKLSSATAGVLVDYSGISVADDTALRRQMREANVDYSVVKQSSAALSIIPGSLSWIRCLTAQLPLP